MKQYPPELIEAIRLYKEQKPVQSRETLRSFICNQCNQLDALLWLAKVSPNQDEAVRAAELAFYLDPDNEIAKRAVASVHDRFSKSADSNTHLELLKLTGMSLTQARAVNWPFRGLQKPIGLLLDEATITTRDLGWAVQNVTDPYIRQATRTILLSTILEEKVNSSEPAKVIQGINFSRYQIHLTTLWGGISIGILVALVLMDVFLVIWSTFFQKLDPIIFTLLYAIGIPATIGAWFFASWLGKRMDTYRAGEKGEDKILDILKASLSKPWVIIHNLAWVDRKWGDIDLALVGPGGIWVLEVKAYTNKIRVSGNRWQYKSRFGWREIKNHPGRQAQRNAMRLKEYLNQMGQSINWVQPIVVWAGQEDLISVDDSQIPVWTLENIQNCIEDLWVQRKLNESQIQDITSILETIVEKFKAKW